MDDASKVWMFEAVAAGADVPPQSTLVMLMSSSLTLTGPKALAGLQSRRAAVAAAMSLPPIWLTASAEHRVAD
jgi:hypothetical protein